MTTEACEERLISLLGMTSGELATPAEPVPRF